MVATTTYRALETDTAVNYRVSPSRIDAGMASGLLVGVASMFTVVTGR